MDELDKLHELYERLTDVRRDLGESQVPFHKFAALVREQVTTLKKRGAPEVAFRVAVQDGKIAFIARGWLGSRRIDVPGNRDRRSESGDQGAGNRGRRRPGLAFSPGSLNS